VLSLVRVRCRFVAAGGACAVPADWIKGREPRGS
jgi:hypothetical protein